MPDEKGDSTGTGAKKPKTLDVRLQEQESTLKDHKKRIEEIEKNLLDRLNSLDEGVAGIGKQLEQINKALPTASDPTYLKDVTDSIEGLRGDLASGLAQYEKTAVDLLAQVKGVDEKLGAIGQRIDDIYEVLDGLKTKVNGGVGSEGDISSGYRVGGRGDSSSATSDNSERYRTVAREIERAVKRKGGIECYPPLSRTVETIINQAGLSESDSRHVLKYLIATKAIQVDGIDSFQPFKLLPI